MSGVQDPLLPINQYREPFVGVTESIMHPNFEKKKFIFNTLDIHGLKLFNVIVMGIAFMFLFTVSVKEKKDLRSYISTKCRYKKFENKMGFVCK